MAVFVPVATLDKTILGDTSNDARVAKYWGTIAIPAYAAAAASCTLTSDTHLPLDGSKILLGAKTYTLKTALSSPAVVNEVLIGATAADTLDNLKAAVDAGAGEGSTYSTGTLQNATISGSTNSDTAQIFVADATGLTANAYMTISTDPHLTFGGATMSGGRVATTYVTGGTGATLSFAGVIPGNSVPIEVEVWSDDKADGYEYRFVRGTTLANGLLYIFTNAGTLAGPLVELGNMNTPAAISGDTKLRFKAYVQTGK